MKLNNENEKTKQKSRELFEKINKECNIEPTNIIIDDDFTPIVNRCCENILGYMKIPLGVSKDPLIINNLKFVVPLCTTEGALVASMCRGIKLVNLCGGISGIVENLGITRSFAIKFDNFKEATTAYKWMKIDENVNLLKKVGNRTSNYLKVKSIKCKHIVNNTLFIKVYAYTGDAMGMNMITKACNQISKTLIDMFDMCELICISANICTDKKWSIENYCNGRGRRVFMNIEIPNSLCEKILKVSIHKLYETFRTKISIGSALVLGNFNCQASNYITATFIAFGQDVAQAIESSNCLIDMALNGNILNVSLWMPSLVVGTIGGGTHLLPQNDFLQQFYHTDSDSFITDRKLDSGIAPNYLALVIAGAVLCGELSCMASLAENSLLDAHLNLNRKK